MPPESLPSDSSNKNYANKKNIYAPFFAFFWSYILELLYLYNFCSPRSEIWSFGSLLSIISNLTSQTKLMGEVSSDT